jgi:hypothetical protein
MLEPLSQVEGVFAREIPFYQVQPCQSGFSFPSQKAPGISAGRG